MATIETKLDGLMKEIHELEDFLYALIPALDEKDMRPGENLLPYAKKLKLKIPRSISGLDVTWKASSAHSPHQHRGESLVLVRPGQANAVGLTLGCIDIGGWEVCLECGFFYCRIVITKRF
jgi:hypothetical protein